MRFLAFPEIQEKVRDEVISVLIKYDGILNYKTFQEIKYNYRTCFKRIDVDDKEKSYK